MHSPKQHVIINRITAIALLISHIFFAAPSLPAKPLSKVTKNDGSRLVTKPVQYLKTTRTGQVLSVRAGSLLTTFKGKNAESAVILTENYQITFSKIEKSQFQHVTINKNTKNGNVSVSLKKNPRNNTFQYIGIYSRPHIQAAGPEICNATLMQSQVKQMVSAAEMLEAEEIQEQINQNKNVNETCKNLDLKKKDSLFEGVQKGVSVVNDRETELSKCLDGLDTNYDLFLKYFASSVFLDKSNISLTCQALPKGTAGLFTEGAPPTTDTITFDPQNLAACSSDDVSKLFLHEALHGAGVLMQRSGLPIGDPHDAINCCLEKMSDSCHSTGTLTKPLYDEQLRDLAAMPSIHDYFEKKKYDSNDAIKSLSNSYKERILRFASIHPECTSSKELSESCKSLLETDVLQFQAEWLKKCPDCNGIQSARIDISIAVEDFRKIVWPQVLLDNPSQQKAQMYQAFTASRGDLVLPQASEMPAEVAKISEMAETLRVREPDGDGARSQELAQRTDRVIESARSMADTVFSAILPQAQATVTQRSPAANSGSTYETGSARQNGFTYSDRVDNSPTQVKLDGLNGDGSQNVQARVPFGKSQAGTSDEKYTTTDGRSPGGNSNTTAGSANGAAGGANGAGSASGPRAAATSTQASTAGAASQPLNGGAGTASNTSSKPKVAKNETRWSGLMSNLVNGKTKWNSSYLNQSDFLEYLRENRIRIQGSGSTAYGAEDYLQLYRVQSGRLVPVQADTGNGTRTSP